MFRQQLHSVDFQGCQALDFPSCSNIPPSTYSRVRFSRSFPAHFLPHGSPPNLIQSSPALEKLLPPYFPGRIFYINTRFLCNLSGFDRAQSGLPFQANTSLMINPMVPGIFGEDESIISQETLTNSPPADGVCVVVVCYCST